MAGKTAAATQSGRLTVGVVVFPVWVLLAPPETTKSTIDGAVESVRAANPHLQIVTEQSNPRMKAWYLIGANTIGGAPK